LLRSPAIVIRIVFVLLYVSRNSMGVFPVTC